MSKYETVESYIENIDDPKLKRLAKKVRTIARKSIPEAEEGIKMGIPCFSIGKKMVASIADYTEHINLYFPEGAKLSSPLLEGTGNGMRHIKISSESDIESIEFSRLLKEALRNAIEK